MMMLNRLSLTVAMLMGCVSFANADTFLGRNVAVADGRASGGPAPMVVLLHGALGTGEQVMRSSGFSQLADEYGLIVLAPNGHNRRWLDGRQGPDPADVNFLSALIENAVERGLADPTRVYLIGHSNGGGMAMRMACDRPDLVAGIGVVATKVLEAYPCTGGAPVPAIFFHGTDDRIAPHEGREGGRLGDTYSSVDSLAIWAERNGCARPGEAQHVDARPGDGTSLEIVNYRGCDAPLTYVVIEGGGHGWPGAARGGPLSGRITREINAGRASLRALLRQ